MKSSLPFGAVCLFLLTSASAVSGASFTWTGGGNGSAVGDWRDKQNWGGANFPQAIADEAIFTSVFGSSQTPAIGAATSVGRITYNSGAAVFTVGGAGPLTLQGIGGIGIQNGSAANETFSVTTINLGADQAWNVNSSGNLIFSGTTLALGTRALTLGGSGAGSISIANLIGGSGSITKSGNNTLTLSGANTYSGLTTISGGTVGFSGSGRLGSGGVALNGGTLQITSDAQLGTAGGVTLGGGTLSASGTFSSTRAVNLTGGGTIGSAGALTLSGVLSGAGGFTKSGAGSLDLTGANTYTGPTVVSGGTLNANSISGLGASSSISLSGATLGLGANLTMPGPLTAGAGAVLNQNTSASTFGNLAVNGNTTFNLGASGSLTFASASYSGGLLTINNWNGPAYDQNALNPGGAASGIFITSDPTGSGLLANVQFNGGGGYPQGANWIAGTGELVPVPEPQVYAALFGMGLLGFAMVRRRLMATV